MTRSFFDLLVTIKAILLCLSVALQTQVVLAAGSNISLPNRDKAMVDRSKVNQVHEELFRRFGRFGFEHAASDARASTDPMQEIATPADPLNPDPYVRLGLPRNATEDEIRKAHRSLAKKYHPDQYQFEDANKIMASINDAKDILLDPVQKSRIAARANVSDTMRPSPTPRGDFLNQLAVDIRRDLQKLADENPLHREWILKALEWAVPEGRNHDLAMKPQVDPIDRTLIDFILQSKNQVLLTALIQSVIEERWSDPSNKELSLDILLKIMNLENRVLNNFLAAMMYAPWWIDERGARILSDLLDREHYFEVVRSLHLGGFLNFQKGEKKTWIESSTGKELLLRALRQAPEQNMWEIDNAFFGQSYLGGSFIPHKDSLWIEKLRQDPKFTDATYISGHSLRALGLLDQQQETKAISCEKILLPKAKRSRATKISKKIGKK